MNIIHQIERLQKLNKLIEQERTGTPSELASRLGVSRSKLYELLGGLKSFGKNVAYRRSYQTFYYTDERKLEIAFAIKLEQDDVLKKINGGGYLLFDDYQVWKYEIR